MEIISLGVWTHSYLGPTTSFYLKINKLGILLDTGIDPIGQMRTFNILPTECTHLFLSHLHSDHSSGFSNFVFTRELLLRQSKNLNTPLVVMTSESIIHHCKQLLQIQYPDREFNIVWLTLETGIITKITETETIITVPAVHSIECHGCRISSGENSIGFTSDTAPSDKHISFFSKCTVLIGEAFGIESRVGISVNKKGHSTAEDLGKLVTDCEPNFVIPFHFGSECTDVTERMLLLNILKQGNSTVIDPINKPRLTVVS